MELCDESLKVLLNYWIGERNFARDCRWTQAKFIKIEPERKEFWKERHEMFNTRYNQCNKIVKIIRKEM